MTEHAGQVPSEISVIGDKHQNAVGVDVMQVINREYG